MADPSTTPQTDPPAERATMAEGAQTPPKQAGSGDKSPMSSGKGSPGMSPNTTGSRPTSANNMNTSNANAKSPSNRTMYDGVCSKSEELGLWIVRPGDPQKQKEREERVRLARERQEEERKRKLEDIQNAQQRAQEFREKQQQERRRKLQEMCKQHEKHRLLVEERRKKVLDEENERRQALLRKSADRDTKLEILRTKRGSSGSYGFGSRTPRMVCDSIDYTKRAASHGSLLRRSPNNNVESPDPDNRVKVQRRAVSACSLNRKSTAASDKNGTLSASSPRGTENRTPPSSSMKRLSASTSHLAKKKPKDSLTGSSGVTGSVVELRPSPSKAHQRTPPTLRRPRSSQSDHTISSSDGSPVRKPRPHSIVGRFPSYASPTVSSQARIGRSHEKKLTATSMSVKSRSKSADTSLRRSRPDLQKTLERLAAPKAPPKEPKEPLKTSPVKSTPPRMQPVVPRVVPRDVPTRPASASTNKNVTPTKGPVKAVHIKVSSTRKAKTPSPKEGSPVKERSPTPKDIETPGKKNEKEPTAEEYKAKLAERRRQAREKAEREAEEERMKNEELRRQEEERIRKEEEEQRLFEEEQQRLCEEARKAEELRLQKAIEEEEQRRKAEEERLEEERKAKEEADRLAKEEAERKEKERIERAKREEEERLERKKRLEMIMKRVKTDDTSPKEDSPSPSKANVSPPGGTPENEKAPEPEVMENSVPAPTPDMTPSPEQAVESAPAPALLTPEEDNKPKFKSPLLQQMLGKKNRTPFKASTEKLAENKQNDEEDNGANEVNKDEEAAPEVAPETKEVPVEIPSLTYEDSVDSSTADTAESSVNSTPRTATSITSEESVAPAEALDVRDVQPVVAEEDNMESGPEVTKDDTSEMSLGDVEVSTPIVDDSTEVSPRSVEDVAPESAEESSTDATEEGDARLDSASGAESSSDNKAVDSDKDVDTAQVVSSQDAPSSTENMAEASEITLQTETLLDVSELSGASNASSLPSETGNAITLETQNTENGVEPDVLPVNGIHEDLDMDMDNPALLDASVAMKLQSQSGLGQGLASELEQESSPDMDEEVDSGPFDQLIHLDNEPPSINMDSSKLINLDADLINSNSVDEEPPQTTPLIAFEENTNIKQDNLHEILSS